RHRDESEFGLRVCVPHVEQVKVALEEKRLQLVEERLAERASVRDHEERFPRETVFALLLAAEGLPVEVDQDSRRLVFIPWHLPLQEPVSAQKCAMAII